MAAARSTRTPCSPPSRATAGYYGHILGKSLALGYIDTAYSEVGTQLEIEILGQRKKATVLIESPLDPDNTQLRA